MTASKYLLIVHLNFFLFYQQKTKDFNFTISKESAKVSKVLKEIVEDNEDKTISIPFIYKGKLCKRAFEFCELYSRKPYPDITHPLDNQKELPNFYNEVLDDLNPVLVISLLVLSDYLHITPFNKLICFHLAYLMRDMENYQRLDYFNISDPTEVECADM